MSSSGIMVMGFASLLRVSSSLDIVTWLAINYQPQHKGMANLNRPCHPGNQLRTGLFCFHFSGCPHPRTQIHTRVIILTCQHEQLGSTPARHNQRQFRYDACHARLNIRSDTGHYTSKSQMPPIHKTIANLSMHRATDLHTPSIVLGVTHIRLYINY